MRKFKILTLVPKNGKGCTWFVKDYELSSGNRYVNVFSNDGFSTIVELDRYIVCR